MQQKRRKVGSRSGLRNVLVVPITHAHGRSPEPDPELADSQSQSRLGGPLFFNLSLRASFPSSLRILQARTFNHFPSAFSAFPPSTTLCLRLGTPWTLNANKSELLSVLSSFHAARPRHDLCLRVGVIVRYKSGLRIWDSPNEEQAPGSLTNFPLRSSFFSVSWSTFGSGHLHRQIDIMSGS
jgi:hypothetical protein